ncbi:tetratricopeptide repeat protein [Planctomyces sp. SH-PL62]|uniref:tetratricopeptide repeat protein n=1 Tax=Planctomyces sp. SH-PL62 TaxID=1636152 RepID=UPI0018D4054F|nr:tetratricopeptide repeat protein [Planctomyces sp. SH-PL62]
MSKRHYPALTIRVARRYLIDYPDDGVVWMWLGDVLTRMARYEEAEQAIAKALEFCPPDLRRNPLLKMGYLFDAAGDQGQAAAWYRKAIEADPGHAAGRIWLGELLARQGRLHEAEDLLRAGLTCAKGYIDEANLQLGFVLRARERFREAAACFREALRLDPERREARHALRDVEACIRWEERRSRPGRSSLRRREGERDEDERYERLRRLSEGPFPASTIRVARRYLTDYPDDAVAWVRLGEALVKAAHFQEAEGAIARALELFPAEGRRLPLMGMGYLFDAAGDLEKATAWYTNAVEADPDHAAGRIFLGGVLTRQGRLHEAEEVHRAGVACEKGRVDEAYFNLGLVLRCRERFHEAAECFREAIRLDPEYREARSALRDVEACIRWEGRRA